MNILILIEKKTKFRIDLKILGSIHEIKWKVRTQEELKPTVISHSNKDDNIHKNDVFIK